MSKMFSECYKLKEIKGIFNFNTCNVSNMSEMFQQCKELEYIDLTNFETSNVTDMGCMFNECNKLKEIKGIKKLNTRNVRNMNSMFQFCNEIKNLDLSNFDTSKVNDMSGMFNFCYKLKEIKGIYNFRIADMTNLYEIFDECNDLKYIYKEEPEERSMTNCARF